MVRIERCPFHAILSIQNISLLFALLIALIKTVRLTVELANYNFIPVCKGVIFFDFVSRAFICFSF